MVRWGDVTRGGFYRKEKEKQGAPISLCIPVK